MPTTPDPVWFSFMGGAVGVACLIAAIFFLKFWRRTRDRLFLAFAVAFVLLALNNILPVFLGGPSDQMASVYLLRLAAFGVIILAIVSKNLRRPGA